MSENKNIFVANLADDVTNGDLRNTFQPYGNIVSATVVLAKGFGFVEMETRAQSQAAIKALDGTDLSGKPIAVKEARPKTDSFSGEWGNRSY